MKLLIVYEIYSIIFGILAGLYAVKKNRNPYFWGGLTSGILLLTPFLFKLPGFYNILISLHEQIGKQCKIICYFPWGFVIIFSILYFSPKLCPQCHKHSQGNKTNTCPPSNAPKR